MAFIDYEGSAARGGAPVDRAHAVAGYEVADIRVFHPVSLRSRDLAPGEGLRLHRREEPTESDRPWVRLEAMGRLDARRPGDETERVSRSNPHLADVVHAPARAADRELELALLTPAKTKAVRATAVGKLDTSGELHRDVGAVDRALGVKRHDQRHVGVLDRPFVVQRHGRFEAGISHPGAERQSEREGSCQDSELGAAKRERPDQPERGQRRVSEESRIARTGHVCARCRTSSARGVGTVSSTSRTRSSPVIRCTHSSGRSTSRCASAGTAIALTSSGRT